MQERRGRPVEILLVEDNPGDVLLTKEALQEARIANNMTVAQDGEQALKMLREVSSAGEGSERRPDLILLDLNLPRVDGRDVLREIKGDRQLRRIPVIVLTTSQAEQDILSAYDSHANCYISKPVDMDNFLSVVRTVEGFWLHIVKLPDER